MFKSLFSKKDPSKEPSPSTSSGMTSVSPSVEEPSVTSVGKDVNGPSLPMFGPKKPETREELAMYMQPMLDEHGSKNALGPLAKTNTKYMHAKKFAAFGETDEAEKTAVGGMFDLVSQNKDTVLKDDFASHMDIQAKDRAFHQSITAKDDNPYGPLTSAVTDYVPTSVRALYSFTSSSIPQVIRAPDKTSK